MFVLIIGIVLFFGVHLIPLTSAKVNLVERMGEKKYQGVFSIFSLIGLIVMIYGFSLVDDCNPMMADCDTNNIHFWEPLEYSREISFILMPISIILLVAFLVESNIKRILRHPWLFAIILWSFCHLISNGDLRSVLLFASFGVYSIIDIVFSKKEVQTSESLPVTKDVIVIVAGLILYSILLYFHQYVSGEQIVEKNNLFFFLP